MIKKYTQIICDNCGQCIDNVEGNPPRQYTEFAKQRKFIVKYTNGGRRDFCNEECYREWRQKP